MTPPDDEARRWLEKYDWPRPVPMPAASPNQARILSSLLSDGRRWTPSDLKSDTGLQHIYGPLERLWAKGCIESPSLFHRNYQITDSGIRTLARFNAGHWR